IVLIVVIMLFQQYFQIQQRYTNFTILGHLHYFVVGFFLVDIYLNEWKNGIKRHPVYNFLCVAALFTLVFVWSWKFPFLNCLVFTFSLLVLFYSAFKATWFNRFITLPWITAIGGMCYSIYLIHLPITELFIRLTKNIVLTDYYIVNYLFQLILLLPLLLFCSIVFYLAIEKPCMYKDWPQRLKEYIKRQLT